MIKINSLTFGEIEIDESTVYTFKDGIPGLSAIKRYAIVESDDLAPFSWLQSCEEPFLSIMMLDPALIDPTYKVRLADEHVSLIGEFNPEEIGVRVLVVVPKDPSKMTANLLAPIILNPKTLKGAQIVVEGTRDMLRVKVINS